MFTSLILFGAAFLVGALIGFAMASMMAATRQAELRDLWDKASRDAGRAERELARLQARCQRVTSNGHTGRRACGAHRGEHASAITRTLN